MVRDIISGKMEASMRVNGDSTNVTARVSTSAWTVVNIKVSGFRD
jgi:hypothetical protein